MAGRISPNDFRAKYTKYLNEWECDLLIYQKLCNNFDYPLFDSSKLDSVRLELNDDLEKLDLQDVDYQDLYEVTLQRFYGKSGSEFGQFYTPKEIKQLYPLIAHCYDDYSKWERIYDPTCGTGGLLLEFPNMNRYVGTEYRKETSYLANMNLKYHLPDKDVKVIHANALEFDFAEEDKHDLVVANPPYGIKYEPREGLDFGGAYSPKRKADWAFIKHMLNSVKNDGLIVTLCYPSIFFRRGAERSIRKWLIEQNYVEAVIDLPDKMFTFTTINTTLLVLRKNRTTNKIFMGSLREAVERPIGAKLNHITDWALNDFVCLYRRFLDGDLDKEISHERRERKLGKARVIEPEDVLKSDNYVLSPEWYTFLDVKEAEPYDDTIHGRLLLIKAFLDLKNQMDIDYKIKQATEQTNPTRELFLERLKPVIDRFARENEEEFEDVMSVARERFVKDE